MTNVLSSTPVGADDLQGDNSRAGRELIGSGIARLKKPKKNNQRERIYITCILGCKVEQQVDVGIVIKIWDRKLANVEQVWDSWHEPDFPINGLRSAEAQPVVYEIYELTTFITTCSSGLRCMKTMI